MIETLDRQRRVRALFEELRAQLPTERARALAAACAGDDGLRDELSALLMASAADSFLEHGAAAAFGSGPGGPGPIGRRIGPYEVEALLGAGGMGEVYRARDTALGRDVALKRLPDLLAADPDRVVRFRREAQLLAALNHPNVAAIYGIEESEEAPILVLELVPGPTLAERIESGPLKRGEAVAIARQIADALEAAHAQAIVHRDLKPANVKLRADGSVKVLDFGLAKALDPLPADASGSRAAASSPTLTRAGAILGTAAYMSPEQAKGRPVDARTDVWAFGCVLFEMLTGRRAFEGEDVMESLSAVLTKEPDWSRLPADTPDAIRRLLRRVLVKDRGRRLAAIADARLELDEVGQDATAPSLRPFRRWIPWSIAAGLAALAALLGLRLLARPQPEPAAVYRVSLALPGRLGAARSATGPLVALSSDGRRVAFVASDADGHSQLWVRSLDSLVAQPLAETRDAQSPFWSPDGRWLGFFQKGVLKKIDISGGHALTLCGDALSGGAWSRDGVILFTQPSGTLAQVPAAGGAPSPVSTVEHNGGEVFNVGPSFLPDGRSFVYVSLGVGSVHTHVTVASLDAGISPVRLPLETPIVQYASGHLWFVNGSTLMALPFDPMRRTVSGEAVPVAEQVRIGNGWIRLGVFSVADAGTLVYQADPSPGRELAWHDRSGRVFSRLGAPADYSDVQMAPDGRRVLVSVAPSGNALRDLWIFDVGRGLRTRFTFDRDRPIRTPIWSPDGRRIVYASERAGHVVLLQKESSGGEPTVLFDDPYDKEPVSWSPDGRFILYMRRASIGSPEPWVLPLQPRAPPYALPQSRARFPHFSPDGRFVAYTSPESGRNEVYVAPFPGTGSGVQVSSAGGFNPRWRADGREILYLDQDQNALVSAAVVPGKDRVEVGAVKALFELPWIGPRFSADVSPDGQRILAVTQPSAGGSLPLTLVIDWPVLLRR